MNIKNNRCYKGIVCGIAICLASLCLAIDKPDFEITITSGNIVPWVPAPIGIVEGSITVCNTGTAPGDAGRLTYWADWDWTYEMITNQPLGSQGGVDVGILQVGQSKTYSLNGLYPATTYGTHTMLFYVESLQLTEEYSEWNNLLSFTYEFTGNPSNYKEIPDLAITNIVLTPENPQPGQSFTARVDIVNSGYADSDSCSLSVWESRSERAENSFDADFTVNVGSLLAGECKTISISDLTAPNISSGSTHHFRAFVDSTNGITETSEGNNQLTTCYFFQ